MTTTPQEVVPIEGSPEEEQERIGPSDPGNPSERRDPPSQQEVEQELARDILRIHEESYGKGARTPVAFVRGDWAIVILDELELLPNEKFLVENGDAQTVQAVRTQYQQAIQSSFRAAVERATGRTVVAFSSASNVEEPSFVTEIFKLR
jgi:uncharacterized protein YbcI